MTENCIPPNLTLRPSLLSVVTFEQLASVRSLLHSAALCDVAIG